ncbi:ParA family protein [Cerasicoccus arenae]|nr:ParA family protein [Cerasicoccus arenae]MBK1857760.1 ParA family protein [Cerasicoccus arenae]
MKVIAFMNFKGGSGKTTLTCLSALYLAAAKSARVRIRDLDRGGDAEAFTRHIQDPAIQLFQPEESQDAYDYLLIDTPGGIHEKEMRSIAQIAHRIVIPFALSPTDIRRSRQTVEALQGCPQAKVLLNQVNAQTNAYKQREALVAKVGIPALSNFLSKRVAYSYALAGGSSQLTTECIRELALVVEEMIA